MLAVGLFVPASEARFARGLITEGIGVDRPDGEGETGLEAEGPVRISSTRLLAPKRPPSGVLRAEVGLRKLARLLGRL